MIDTKDLMIGDWVTVLDSPAQVYGISKDESCEQISVKFFDGERLTVNPQIVSVSPIPLTAEILDKDGWKMIDARCGRIATFRIAPFDVNWLDGQLLIKRQYGNENRKILNLSHIDSVHTLQHALRVCGIGKEIML